MAALLLVAAYIVWSRPRHDLARRIESLDNAQPKIDEVRLFVDDFYVRLVKWSQARHKTENEANEALIEIRTSHTSQMRSIVREVGGPHLALYDTTICNLDELQYLPSTAELASTVSDERFVRPASAEDPDLNELKRKALRSAFFYYDHAKAVLSTCSSNVQTRRRDLEIERLEFGREGLK